MARTVATSGAGIATLATPVLGVLSGAILLGEPVGWREIASLTLVGTKALQEAVLSTERKGD